MSKYKRWILLLTALTVSVVNVESLKATSLIHAGKFPKLQNLTTSASTTEESPSNKTEEAQVEVEKEENYVEVNGTRIALTGIPQIDYVWDPNLPRELNGFNLSTYPFIDSMPAEEDIGFDCDDKINGFYASIKYGCQIYHHCLYGIRSDFICANFTAFDQKTFICHFASEVDCKNSYKYWNRNEDLYKATTEKATTSLAGLVPLIDRNLYKRPLPGSTAGGTRNAAPSRTREPAVAAQDTPQAAGNPLPPARNNDDFAVPAVGQRQPNRPLRRPPFRRRRPQVDYYYYDDDYEEEFYDDRSRRRQQRPRNRRPVYDDYDSRRPESRRPVDDDFDDYEYERRPYRSRNRSESRKNGDDRRKIPNEERRFDDRRRPYNEDRKPVEDRRRPAEDERRSYDDRKFPDDRHQSDERKRHDEDRGQTEERKVTRRKNADEPADDRRKDRYEPSEKRQATEESANDDKPVKPVVSLFDRPRVSPKIARPVPLGEKTKFSSKVENSKKKEEEYDDEYEDPPVVSSSTTTTTQKPSTTTRYSPRRGTSTSTRKPSTTTLPEAEYYDDEYEDNLTPSSTTQKPIDRSAFFNRNANKPSEKVTFEQKTSTEKVIESYQQQVNKPSAADNFRLNRFKTPNDKLVNETAIRDNAASQKIIDESTSTQPSTRKPLPLFNNKKFASQQTLFESTTTETTRAVPQEDSIDTRFNSRETDPVEDPRMVVRVIKRPFLPSRGGNPYKGRGLQPVGPASQSEASLETFLPSVSDNTPAPVLKTTLEDIYNEEYDVELNDALNPMLKPLTSSRGISGFSFSSLPNENSRDGYRSQSIKNIQRAEAPKTSTTTTTAEPPQYEYYDDDYESK